MVVSCLTKATVPRVSRRWHAKLDGFKASPRAKKRDGGSSGGSWPLPAPKSAQVVCGQRRRPLRTLIDSLMWRNGNLEASLLEQKSCENPRGAMEPLHCAWDVGQRCRMALAPSGRTRRNRRRPGHLHKRLRCPGSSASPWFAASCCGDGSLAVIEPLWVQLTPEELSSFDTVHPHAYDVPAPVGVDGIETERYCSTACATSPLVVGRDRSFRDWSVDHDRSPQWVGRHG